MRPMTQPEKPDTDGSTDTGSQLEELFAAVWHAEENWRFDDRLDLSQKLQRGPRRGR